MTNARLIAAVVQHHAKLRMPQPPSPRTVAFPPGDAAEMACRYRRGESIAELARAYHCGQERMRRTLVEAGVTIRTWRQQRALNTARQDATTCRCCGIILKRAGCGVHEGACDDCWWEALKRARRWGCGLRAAMARWIEEGRRVESGESELGGKILDRRAA